MADKKRILVVVGTLREMGFNLQLAHEVERVLGERAEVSYLDYRGLPFMNQDREDPELPEVAAVRAAVREADGVWVVSPQYNGLMPGHVKNLVDWLSRPLPGQGRESVVIAGVKVTVSGAGGRSATAQMRAALDGLLSFVGADVMDGHETGVALPGESWATGRLVLSDEDRAHLAEQADAFLEFVG